MPAIRRILPCLALIVLPAFAAQPPNEDNCRRAIEMARQKLSEYKADTPRDKQDLQNIKDRQEKLIADNRRKGVNECTTWSQVMGLAFNQ